MDKTNFVFVNCQGLGFQSGAHLSKISSAAETFAVEPDAAVFLINDDGAVLCSLVSDRAEYEHAKNQDRRVANVNNGFDVKWQPNGLCTVSRELTPKRKSINKRPLVICGALAALACVVCLLWAWLSPGDKTEGNESTPQTVAPAGVLVGKHPIQAYYVAGLPGHRVKTDSLDVIESVRGTNEFVKFEKTPQGAWLAVYWEKTDSAKYAQALNGHFTAVGKSGNEYDIVLADNDIDISRYASLKEEPRGGAQVDESPIIISSDFAKTFADINYSDYATIRDKVLPDVGIDQNLVKYILDKAADNALNKNGTAVQSFLDIFADKYSLYPEYQRVKDFNGKKNSADAVKKEAVAYKAKLHSDNCSLSTVSDVEKWWKGKTKEQQAEIVKQSGYDFGAAIDAYKQFFGTSKQSDIAQNNLTTKANKYFSKNQRDIVWYYGHNMYEFKGLVAMFGVQFAGPIKAGYHKKRAEMQGKEKKKD